MPRKALPKEQNGRGSNIGLGAALGMMAGTVIGVITDQIGMGIALGMMAGVVVAILIDAINPKKDREG